MGVASSAWRPSKAKRDVTPTMAVPSPAPCKKQKQESEGKATIWKSGREAEQRDREQRRESKAESMRLLTTNTSNKAEVKRNGSSGSSDQATDTEIILSSSPDLHGFAGGDLPICSGRLESVSGPVRDDRWQHMSAACQAGDGIVLPRACITGIAASLSAAAASMCSLSPFDLHTPAMVSNGIAATAGPSAKPEDDPAVKEMLNRAKGIKKAADAGRGPKGELSVLLLCRYIESALVYMEACEHVLSSGGGSSGGAGKIFETTSTGLKLSSKVTLWWVIKAVLSFCSVVRWHLTPCLLLTGLPQCTALLRLSWPLPHLPLNLPMDQILRKRRYGSWLRGYACFARCARQCTPRDASMSRSTEYSS